MVLWYSEGSNKQVVVFVAHYTFVRVVLAL